MVARDAPGGRPARVLVIGAGVFTFGRGRRPENAAEVLYVDVGERLDETADASLAPLRQSGTYEPVHGRAYLLRQENAFDVFVLDAFADRVTIPPHLYTRESFALARSRLAEHAERST